MPKITSQDAHGVLSSIMNQRKERAASRASSVPKYRLEWANRLSNNPSDIEGSRNGATIKELQKFFLSEGGAFRYAFITNISGTKLFRVFDRVESRKFVAVPTEMQKR